MARRVIGWTIIISLTLCLILVPFFLYEGKWLSLSQQLLAADQSRWLISSSIVLLLAADILLPIPSSLISTAAGSVFGFGIGMLLSWLGMMLGCVFGYALGALAGPPTVQRLIGRKEMTRCHATSERHGQWILILFRAVPVLAEASVLFAGMSKMTLNRFLLLTAFSNLGISMVYATLGATAADLNSFLLVFIGAITVPAIAMLAARGFTKRKS